MQGARLSAPSRTEPGRSVWWAAADARGPAEPAPALEADLDCDVAIIGGGFTGTSTAYHLARRFPTRRIVLLEAVRLGHGASGRSGGLVLNWLNAPVADTTLARRIFEVTRSGIDALEARIRDHDLDVPFRRGACAEVFTDSRHAELAAQEVERLNAAGVPLRFVSGRELDELARLNGARGAVYDPTAGYIDGLRLVHAMQPLLSRLGVSIYEQTPVLGISEGEVHTLRTPRARVRAKAIVLATNAYTPSLGYFRSGVLPLHSYVLATEPLDPDVWREHGWSPRLLGFSDDRNRISYAGMTDRGELVFGGGSNAAYAYYFGGNTELRESPRRTRSVQRALERYLPAAQEPRVRVAHRWSGVVALTLSRMCTMGVQGPHRNVYFALGYSGHGINLANLAGEVLTDLYAGDDSRWKDLPFFQQQLPYLAPEPLRWAGYHVYTSVTGRAPRRTPGR